jgi:hypothetical protein
MKDNVIKTEYGYEIVWTKTNEYCGKILAFESANSKLPLHFHKNRDKSWFVNAGKFKVQWVDTADGKIYAQDLNEGSTFHVSALTPVTLTCLADNSSLSEITNNNDINDYYRLN